MRSRRVISIALFALSAGCATPLGHPKPMPEDILAMRVADTTTAQQFGALLKQHNVSAAILSSAHDSAWYAQVAATTAMKMTRPAHVGANTFAFLGPQALGDTTLTLKVQGGGDIRLHDALYRIDKNRRLDLMAVHIDPGANLLESVHALLAYVSTDVMANAAVVFAIEPPTPALGDSVSILMRAAFTDAWECTKDGKTGSRNTELPMRMFYGPNMHISCDSAERLSDGGTGMLGHFVLTD